MAGVARVGDILGPGGLLTAPFSSTVTVNGRPVALFGCVYTPHPPCGPKQPQHCTGPTFDVPAGVTIENQIPLTKSGKGLCKHGIQTASDDVIIVGNGLLSSALGAALGQIDSGSLYGDLGGLPENFKSASDAFDSAKNSILDTTGLKGIFK